MTATITNHLGHTITGQIRCWMGRRIVEIETSDGGRHIGHLRADEPRPARASTVDSAAVRR
jgi:peptide methionine sulfoxide reductase MsrB